MINIFSYGRLLRPKHWIKNLFLFSAPLFGGNLFLAQNAQIALTSFVSFSLCASAVYIMNDIADRQRDSFHPFKKDRPIASGLLPVEHAIVASISLLLLSIILGIYLSKLFTAILTLYAAMQAFYTFYGKDMYIVDILLVAAGFILRMFAGAIAFEITVSPWLFVCLFTLSLILATGKRLSEFMLLQGSAAQHRTILSKYSLTQLRNILIVTSIASCAFYILYVLEHRQFIPTVPFVILGIYRYLALVSKGFGEPIHAILRDRLLAVIVSAWLSVVIILMN